MGASSSGSAVTINGSAAATTDVELQARVQEGTCCRPKDLYLHALAVTEEVEIVRQHLVGQSTFSGISAISLPPMYSKLSIRYEAIGFPLDVMDLQTELTCQRDSSLTLPTWFATVTSAQLAFPFMLCSLFELASN